MPVPLCRRHLQCPRVFLKIVVDHRERDASLEIGEGEARSPLCGIFVTIPYRSPRRAGLRRQNSIELPEQPFDHATLMDPAAVPVADANPIVLAPTLEGVPFELLGGIGDEQSRPPVYRPAMLDTARGQPYLLWTHGLRKAERDRQCRRLFKG